MAFTTSDISDAAKSAASSVRGAADRILNTEIGSWKYLGGNKTDPAKVMAKNGLAAPRVYVSSDELFYWMKFSFFKYDFRAVLWVENDARAAGVTNRPENEGVPGVNATLNFFGKVGNDRSAAAQAYKAERYRNPLDVVVLPLPRNLIESYDVEWRQGEISVFGKAIADLIGEGKAREIFAGKSWTNVDDLGKILSETATVLKNNAGNLADKAGDVLLQTVINSTPFAATINGLRGKVLNPLYVATFGGVNLRAHQFEWTIIPETRAEMDAIFKIRDVVRDHTLPDYSAKGDIGTLTFPDMVKVEMNPGVFEFPKECFISSFRVNHAPEMAAFHDDNRSAALNITMELLEATAITRDEFKKSG